MHPQDPIHLAFPLLMRNWSVLFSCAIAMFHTLEYAEISCISLHVVANFTVKATSYVLQFGASVFTTLPRDYHSSAQILIIIYSLIFALSILSLVVEHAHPVRRHH